MKTLTLLLLYLAAFTIPLTVYHWFGITLPFWHWAIGLVSGFILGYMDVLLRRCTTECTDLPSVVQPAIMPDCKRCLYNVDSQCWYRYVRDEDGPHCEFRLKSVLLPVKEW